MKESAYLNQFPGIRAASIHNKYVAYMSRKVDSSGYSTTTPTYASSA
jgi:ribose 5-phosphate isomerase RpiB